MCCLSQYDQTNYSLKCASKLAQNINNSTKKGKHKQKQTKSAQNQ